MIDRNNRLFDILINYVEIINKTEKIYLINWKTYHQIIKKLSLVISLK